VYPRLQTCEKAFNPKIKKAIVANNNFLNPLLEFNCSLVFIGRGQFLTK
jgi:hypothetical protein